MPLYFSAPNVHRTCSPLIPFLSLGVDKLKKLDCDRTIGIDVIDWKYPTGNSIFKSAGQPVHFLAWDFAGQVQYICTRYSLSPFLCMARLCLVSQGLCSVGTCIYILYSCVSYLDAHTVHVHIVMCMFMRLFWAK